MAEREADGGTLFGEIRRFARTSGAVGGIAARVAGAKVFGIKTDRAAHAEDLKTILGGLKGPLMKVAQILSTIPDALPDEYAAGAGAAAGQRAADGLGLRPPAHGRASWGRTGSRKFRSFGQEAAAAASLGQVHRATLLDGTEVACKLQYPDMREHGRGRPAAAASWRWRLPAHRQRDPGRRDLRRARRAPARGAGLRARGRAAAALPDHAARPAAASACPSRSTAYTTKRLLTMTWLEGTPIQQLDRQRPAARSSATTSPRRCSTPGTCRSTATA